ncbi:ArsR family transcriptional regulator [Natrarchaeobius oligotrophus]|uniref:ArsR family transcriptional regulator n=1 Tax=Natrarchaeobius chitinivorans TaxID=1679083 RepID=A0A3N6MBD8_NATCH|nr:ArsR family transcriptional regulator [Natrarchaeobius chitinivorans]RQG93750.1 ArsR family transcriptional regulator [Natrarchaeobius chitinivorans]
MSDSPFPTAISDHSSTAKLVYVVLESAETSLTQAEIADRAAIDPRTAREALYALEDTGVITRDRGLTDAREKFYSANK